MEVCTKTLIAATWILCSLIAVSSMVHAENGPTMIETFVHESRVPPATLFLVAPVAGDLSNRQAVSIIVIDNVLRASNESDSDVVGRQLGQVAIGADNYSFHVLFTFLFSNATSYPGAITVTGILQSGTLVVTGGTDTFAFARGIARPESVSDTGATAVYKYKIVLCY